MGKGQVLESGSSAETQEGDREGRAYRTPETDFSYLTLFSLVLMIWVFLNGLYGVISISQ